MDIHDSVDRLLRDHQTRRISRREFVTRALALGVSLPTLGSLLAACSPSAAPSTAAAPTAAPGSAPAATPAATPAAAQKAPASRPTGGTIQVANTADPVFNWFQQSTLPSLYLHKVFFSSLTRFDEKTLIPAPDLAEKWESSDGAKLWTFYLRKGVKWHDGKPLTAHDVKFTYDFITGPRTLRKEIRLAAIKETKVVDDYTVQFVLSQPVAPAPLNLSFNVPIMPKHRLETVDMKTDATFNKSPVGTGPFKFAEQVSGSHVALEANADYFLGRPKIDRFIFKIIPDVNTQIALLKTGELDVAVVEPTHLSAIKSDQNLVTTGHEGTTYFYFAMNTRKEMFADKRVRQALGYAFDRPALIESVLSGQATMGIGPVPPALSVYFNNELKPRPFDVAKAKALLEEAGWKDTNGDGILEKDGKPFRFTLTVDRGNPTRERTVALAQQYWKAIGVDVQIDAKEWNSFVAYYQNTFDKDTGLRPWDMVHCWIGLAPDPDGTREYHSMTNIKEGSRWGYRNQEVDKLLEAGLAETDLQKRAKIYKDFQAVVYEEQPVIYLYYPKELVVSRSRVKGVPSVGGLRVVLAHMEKWYLEGR